MTTIANRKGIILFGQENGTYAIEDNDLKVTFFDDVVEAINQWLFLVSQE